MNVFPNAKIVTEDAATYIVLEGIGRVQVPALYLDKAKEAAGKNLSFGIRPVHLEDAELVGANGTNRSSIDATVDVVENLGNELQVYFTTGGKSGIATLDTRSRVGVGNKVKLYVESEQVHLFDAETGLAVF